MKKRRDCFTDLAVVLAVALGVFVIAFNCRYPDVSAAAPAAASFFVLQPQEVVEEAIPDYAGVRRTYVFDLESRIGGLSHTQTFFVYLRHTNAVLELEGEQLADVSVRGGRWHIGQTPGCYWLTLPIYRSHFSQPMRITLTPVYESVRDDLPKFLLIDRQVLLQYIVLPKEGAILVLSLVAAVAGAFLILFALALGLGVQDRRRVLNLGAASFAAGMWKLCGLSAVPLLLHYYGQQKAIWFTGIIGYLLMPVFTLRHLTVLHGEGRGRFGTVCCDLAAASAALLLALQIGGAVELHDVVMWYGVGMAALHLVVLLVQKPGVSKLLWLLLTFAALGFDYVIFLWRETTATAPAFLIWIMFNMFVRGFGFLREAIDRERQLRVREAELHEARVKSMMNEIRPHFIHNTLTSIYMLCGEDPARAQEVVGNFTTYLQANFSAVSTAELTAFAKELEHTRAYVAVESVLYEGKLTVEYDTAFTAFRLPPLTIQPIVENAVKYGVGTGLPHGQIVVRSRAVSGGAEVVVEDDGIGFDASASETDGAHIGLQNVRERLALMCDGTLEVAPRDGGGTVVRIFVPNAKPEG